MKRVPRHSVWALYGAIALGASQANANTISVTSNADNGAGSFRAAVAAAAAGDTINFLVTGKIVLTI